MRLADILRIIKKDLTVPDNSLHIWTGSKEVCDSIFAGVLSPKGRFIHMLESTGCDNAPVPVAASLAMQWWRVSLSQSSRWLLFEKVQWPYKETFQLGEISLALCYSPLCSPAFPVGELFLSSFSGLTKVIKIATKLSVCNSCVWEKTDKRMLEEMLGFEKLFSFCKSQSCEMEANI